MVECDRREYFFLAPVPARDAGMPYFSGNTSHTQLVATDVRGEWRDVALESDQCVAVDSRCEAFVLQQMVVFCIDASFTAASSAATLCFTLPDAVRSARTCCAPALVTDTQHTAHVHCMASIDGGTLRVVARAPLHAGRPYVVQGQLVLHRERAAG